MKDRDQLAQKLKNLFSPKISSLLVGLIPIIALAGIYLTLNNFHPFEKNSPQKAKNQTPQERNKDRVLAEQSTGISISGSKGGGEGGLVALASTEEPAVYVGAGKDVSGSAEISIYQASEDTLLNYLLHDKNGKQLNPNPDISKFTYVTKVNQQITGGYGKEVKVILPLAETGIWFLRATLGSSSSDLFVIRSNIGTTVKEGDNEYIFWGQNFKTRRSVSEGAITIYDLKDSRKVITSTSFNTQGIAKTKLTAEADIAVIKQGDDKSIIPINLKYLSPEGESYFYEYRTFQPKSRQSGYFIFTDRPLYRPGDKVYFKSVLRDDDDVRYTVPKGTASVKIYEGYNWGSSNTSNEGLVFEKNYPISKDGTINGEYTLPANSKTGTYTLAVSIPGSTGSSLWFDVQFFRKPEYSIDVTTQKTELVAGDNSSFTISGNYFSGQPISNQKVKYTIYSADFYEYSYLTDRSYALNDNYRYGYWGGDKVKEGEVTLDQKGRADTALDTKALLAAAKGKSQVLSIEAEFDDGSGNPSFSRKNILVYAGEFGIYRKDYSYGTKVNTPLSLPVVLVSRHNTNVSGVNLTAKIHRENWISYQEPDKKYPSYKKEEEDLPPVKTKTDAQGNATLNFTPTKAGSYKITAEASDQRGNLVSKEFYSYVCSEDQFCYSGEQDNGIIIQTDKQKYLPTDTVHFTIYSETADRDVFLSLERARVNRFQIVHLTGKSGTVDVPLVSTDMPNMFAKVSSFSNNTHDTGSVTIVVSPESKRLTVKITPDRNKLGPSDNVTINLETKDSTGKPVSADLAVWVVDKAIFELVDEGLGDIFTTFWQERYNDTQEAHALEGIPIISAERGAGCFAAGTPVLLTDKTTKPIEKIKVGDTVLTRESEKSPELVKAKVVGTHQAVVSGYLIINSNLRVTPNHRLWVNDSWKLAGSIQIGDKLTDLNGKSITISSLEWVRGKFTVYNLQIERYKTYFAAGIWAHNDKGGAREIFKDTAYWNPSVHTDKSGKASISFKLPDNLTTWVLSAVGSTTDTKVGQTTSEIVVTKDVIVRPILPNILREGDKVILAALVHNFTDKDHVFDTDLKFDSGDVKPTATTSAIPIKSKETQQVSWNVSPKKENEAAKLTYSATAKEDKKAADTVVQKIPVRPFGFLEQRAETGDGPKTFNVKLSPDSSKQKSGVTISLSPTLVGALPAAMKHLIYYPYGCVEQTTGSLVPAVIAKTNPDLFAQSLADHNLDLIIQKGLTRLANLRHSDGGWAWWGSGKSDTFITAYVVEYLLAARQAGFSVDQELLSQAQSFLEAENKEDTREDVVAKTYALTLLNSSKRKTKLSDLDKLSPDLLSLAVMANVLNGDKNPQSNGLAKLAAAAKTQGDAAFWEAGSEKKFGSKDTSTAFAIRAILTAGGDRNLAVKGAKYLNRNRRYQYWTSTFATAQVVRALVDLSKTGSEQTPNYTYTVSLDKKEIAKGTVNSPKQIIKDIAIPIDKIKPAGSNLAISKSGAGQIYSTLVINEFRTDRNAKAVNHGLEVKREYISDQGSDYSLAVGDTVTVKITVKGLKTEENYGIITDELPAGMIPVNKVFKNEQYGKDPYYSYYHSYDVTDQETTENGVVLSLYQIAVGEHTYTYKARVISAGTFSTPPATASLMYAPEIWGRSGAQTVQVTTESKILPQKAIQKALEKYARAKTVIAGAIILIVLLGAGTIFILKRKGVTIKQLKEGIFRILEGLKTKIPWRNKQGPSQPGPPNNSL
ncbi:MAG: hypothetical protein A2126_02775 [Candidatus Woykebacteria bacterium GWB1_45_5]|uniref:Intein C-terminal splicing domain-containing protein n=2 Tax=Candidatus Woykeibacteriota TaxID=1817899 RepID=A0A1G1VZV2_9BACT|nr:MAG: hypothetical protein A2113_01415 [Candidatus Woykebacteria bacterium GWA1_44_8]OGY24743.1 MAG: hypothetical protein A2126_02775 [Candidatus Woykebacteria bacterium GWB1_45_5]